MLTWDEAKEAVQKAQTTTKDEFTRHLADYVVQGVLDKLIDDYTAITARRKGVEIDEDTIDQIAYEAAIFMTGVQVGWYLGEAAHA